MIINNNLLLIPSLNLIVFNENDPGEKYCKMIIQEGSSVPLVDLADDTPLPSFYNRALFKK